MTWRRRDAPLRGLTCACAIAVILIAALTHTQAAEAEFGYSASVSENYNGDVFRTGNVQGVCDTIARQCIQGILGATCDTDAECDTPGEALDDFITIVGLQGSVNWRTPRSQTFIDFSPVYLKYATFSELDGFNHRLTSSWDMRPGPQSNVGIRVGFAKTNQQSGFQSGAGVGGNPVDPILQLTSRVTWDIEPSYNVEIGRTWTMNTRLVYRSQHFSNPRLTDVATTGLIYAANARMGGMRRLGGVVRYGRNFYDRTTSTTTAGKPRDEVVNLEVSYDQQEGAVFTWRTAAGFFKVVGDNRPASGSPTLRAGASWNLPLSSIQAGYDLGFSTVTGSVGTARSESASVSYSRRWGLGFTASAAARYIRFETLVNDPVERFLDGYSFDVQASYRWPRRWQVGFQMTHLTQEQSNGRVLDYLQGAIVATFTPDSPTSRRGGP